MREVNQYFLMVIFFFIMKKGKICWNSVNFCPKNSVEYVKKFKARRETQAIILNYEKEKVTKEKFLNFRRSQWISEEDDKGKEKTSINKTKDKLQNMKKYL